MIRYELSALRAWLNRAAPSRTIRRQRPSTCIRVEQLEDRVTPSAGLREQYMLELVNRMRENPAAELPLLLNSSEPNVASALTFFNVDIPTLQSQWSSLVAVPPLAWNDSLGLSASTHSQAMLTAGVQSHQVPGEADLGTRVTSAGYSNWNSVGENIFAYAHSVFEAHAAFAIDWGSTPTGIQSPPGHRQNLMSSGFRDIGIGIVDAPNGSSMGPLLITQDFGNRFSYGNPFLLGVVFNDANSNGYYDPGEGLSNVTLTITGSSGSVNTTTTAYGGYQISLAPGNYTVVATGGALNAPVSANVSIGASNVHVNFINGAQPPQNALLPFSDDFNRSDSGSMGPFWTAPQGSLRIANNAIMGNAAANLETVNGVTLANSSTQVDVNIGNVVNQNAGVVARFSNMGNFYLARILRTSAGYSAQIYKRVGGSWTLLAGAPVAFGVGTLRFDVAGSSLKAYFGPNAASLSLVAYAFNSALSAGSTGVWGTANAHLDNFVVDAINGPTSQPLPFSDAFATNAPTQQLSLNWRERGGNYNVAGGFALANGPTISTATVNGVAQANVAVQADVTLGAGQGAGLMARYQANGNFYLAQISANSTGTAFTAYLYKSIGGVFTKLNTTTSSVPSGAGTMRFEVLGNSLKLFFGPDASNLSLVAHAFNSSITAAGQVGMRARIGAHVDNFSVDVIAANNASVPFSDVFTQTNGNQLTHTWTERSGNFGVATTGLVANDAGANLATLNGSSLINTTIQADVAVGANQAAGLIGRYQSNGSYYLAQIIGNSTGSSFTLHLYRFAGGVFTLLKSSTVSFGVGTMRFVLFGSNLQVYYGVNSSSLSLFLNATDTSISAAGLVGIRGNKNATFDNFTVT